MEREIAIYLRLSKADGREGIRSESIKNQQRLLERYIKEDAELCEYSIKIFEDDGFSGLEEKRPALQDMLSFVRKRKIYAVLVKDFSRLSRNHLYLASLCEQVFPACHTELIALGDNYDSRKEEELMLALRFKSLFNEYYSRDISRKVKTSLTAKKEKGEYAVAKPPFGYRSVGGNWIVEEKEANVVRRIFELAAQGHANSGIVHILKEEAPLFPMYPMKVYRILQNPVYCGKHIWHKYENFYGKCKKSILLPKEYWREGRGSHPPIVSEEIFQRVQEKAGKNREDGLKNDSKIFII